MAKVKGEGVPFQEAIDFFRQKTRLPSNTWSDLKHGAHARSFVVAGATCDALLADLQRAVGRKLTEGITIDQFRKEFDEIVARHGWDYKGGRNWRTRVMLNTNVRMAYAAGRWQQAERLADPVGRYTAVLDSDTRADHRHWHGTVLPLADPWWNTHYPPNGWNCRCTVQFLPRRAAERKGWQVSAQAPEVTMERRQVNRPDGGTETWAEPAGVDTGFGYNVGRSWLHGAVPPPLQEPLPPFGLPPAPLNPPPLPAPRPGRPPLPDDLPEDAYVDRFLQAFGATRERPALIRDAAGYRLAIGRELFLERDGTLKIKKRERHRYLLDLVDCLLSPDEIWVGWGLANGRPVLVRRYLRAVEHGGKGGGVAAFEWSNAGWSGRTIFVPDDTAYVDGQRRGALLYRREED
ncbi:MAG: PBECR2 nuclease fold domain-containing protein [Pseudomonadota bacterium]